MNKQKLKGLWIPADRVSKIISSLRDKNYIKVKLKYKTDSKEIEERQILPIVENINRCSQKHLEGIDINNYSDSQKQPYPIGDNDKDIINAIKYHTTGKEDMDIIEKIIYIADLIEEDRDFPGVEELRDLVYNKELDKALLISFNNTIKFVIDNNQLIHNRTVDARNYLIKNKIL